MIINDDVSIGFTITNHRQSFSLTFLHLGVITTGCPKDLIFSRAASSSMSSQPSTVIFDRPFELTKGTLMLREIHWSCISSNV